MTSGLHDGKMSDPTIAHLIERAISWELAARDLYVSLSKAFPSHPAVEETWTRMAADEARHASILRQTRDALPESRLSEALGPKETGLIDSVEELLAQARVATLRTLDDAYELAHELEASEVNTVFQLVISLRTAESALEALLDAQLEEHVARLTQLADHCDRATRHSIALRA